MRREAPTWLASQQVLQVHEALELVSESINNLGLVPESIVGI